MTLPEASQDGEIHLSTLSDPERLLLASWWDQRRYGRVTEHWFTLRALERLGAVEDLERCPFGWSACVTPRGADAAWRCAAVLRCGPDMAECSEIQNESAGATV